MNVKFRQIKILTKGNRWLVRSFSNLNSLYKYLEKTEYHKAYWSISRWLNPRSLRRKEHKKGYKIADRCFLGSDLLFDLDLNEDSTFEDVRRDALEIIKRMKKHKNFKLELVQFSGSKGLHLVYQQLRPFKEKDPIKRFSIYQEHRNKLYKEFKDVKTLDAELIKDLYRIFKITNSIDHSTGYKIQKIPVKDLNKSFNHILERIEKSNDLNKRPSERIVRPQLLEEKARTRIRASSHIYNWITNTVYGAKDRLVPYFLFDDFDQEKIEKIQSEYKLGDLFVFDLDGEIGILGIKTLPKSRLIKVMEKSNALNRKELLKRGFNKIRTSRKIYADGEVIKKPSLLYILKSKSKGSNSRPHFNYIKTFKSISYNKLIGVDFKYKYTSGVKFNAKN